MQSLLVSEVKRWLLEQLSANEMRVAAEVTLAQTENSRSKPCLTQTPPHSTRAAGKKGALQSFISIPNSSIESNTSGSLIYLAILGQLQRLSGMDAYKDSMIDD